MSEADLQRNVQPDHPLLFLRHGETPWNAEGRYQGATDISLSSTGQEQAIDQVKLVQKLLTEKRLSAPELVLLSSPLLRARQTAKILQNGLEAITGRDFPLTIEPELRELSFGRWEGLTSMAVKARFYEERKLRKSNRFTFAPQGGDSMAGREGVISDLLRGLQPHTIVVTHSALLRLIAHILGRADALVLQVPHRGGFLWDGQNLKAV